MKLFGATDSAIAEDIGDRLKSLRLDRNYSQKELCELTGLSIKAILNAEKGKSNIVTYIKLLRALNCLDHLENFIPEPGISPMQIVKLSSKKRIRASGKKRIRALDKKHTQIE
jgi:putative transcriptional regulator